MTHFDCTDIKATLSGLIDDQVDAETRHLAERHLSECAECRALMSQAEGLDDLIAMDAAAFSPKRLPDGFAESVLNRTVYARMYENAGFSWTNWLGWVAAAACLCLAATIWFLDRQSIPRDGGLVISSDRQAMNSAPVKSTADDSTLRSFTYDQPLQPTAIRASNRKVIESEAMLDDSTRAEIDAELAMVQPTRSAIEGIAHRAMISEADGDTLHAAALLLDMLADSDLTNFADVEQIRRIAIYDELPQRLADVRTRLRGTDRATVMAAESIVVRIVNGPIDMDDLRLLHETVASLNLATQIGAISVGRDVSTSM